MRWTYLKAPLILACLVPFASAGADAEEWQPVTIQAFLNESGAATWLQNCAGKDGGRIAVGAKDLDKITSAKLDEDRSCVRFDFQNQTYFVRESAVQHSATKQSTAKACGNEQMAAAKSSLTASYGTTEAATMGAGEKPKCH